MSEHEISFNDVSSVNDVESSGSESAIYGSGEAACPAVDMSAASIPVDDDGELDEIAARMTNKRLIDTTVERAINTMAAKVLAKDERVVKLQKRTPSPMNNEKEQLTRSVEKPTTPRPKADSAVGKFSESLKATMKKDEIKKMRSLANEERSPRSLERGKAAGSPASKSPRERAASPKREATNKFETKTTPRASSRIAIKDRDGNSEERSPSFSRKTPPSSSHGDGSWASIGSTNRDGA